MLELIRVVPLGHVCDTKHRDARGILKHHWRILQNEKGTPRRSMLIFDGHGNFAMVAYRFTDFYHPAGQTYQERHVWLYESESEAAEAVEAASASHPADVVVEPIIYEVI